eukprot:SAG31_NODE_1843_length_7106_cov_7.400742_1_plen_527_part_00
MAGGNGGGNFDRAGCKLCTSVIAVEQWRREFTRWTTVPPERVTVFTSEKKETPHSNGIIICTYSILSYSQKREDRAEKLANFIKSRKWGLMILDEVQTAPAEKFRLIMSMVPCHCKLGLTATLVREDGKIRDLLYLLGPKIHEANWIELQNAEYIARVKCAEVWVPMTPEFYSEYLDERPHLNAAYRWQLRKNLWVMNPNKFHVLEYLIRTHEANNDKVIVFSDNTFALRTFAQKLMRPHIEGKSSAAERHAVINQFKKDKNCRCIFASKIADNAIDLPDANVLIQISSHGAGRRQEAQRLGRILRKKQGAIPGEIHAFFYSIISQDTKEMSYNHGRQRFLVDQGYAYQVLQPKDFPNFEAERAANPFQYSTPLAQRELLQSVLVREGQLDAQDEEAEVNASITQNCVAVVQAFYVSWLTIIPCLHLAVRYSLLTTHPRLAALGRRSIHVRCHCRAPRRDQCRRHASQITQILRSQETSSLSSHRRHVALSSVGRGDHTLRCARLADEAVVKRHRRLVSENLAVLT